MTPPTAQSDVKPAAKRPNVWHITGWVAFALSMSMNLRLVYEQTAMTWSQGPQMIGFTIAHTMPFLLISGLVGNLACLAWIVCSLSYLGWSAIRHRRLSPNVYWFPLSAVLFSLILAAIPYDSWQIAMIVLRGPGPYSVDQLSYAAANGDLTLVHILLRKGLTVDALASTQRTALNAACVGKALPVAQFLIDRGADLNKAPDCWKIEEFRSHMQQPSKQEMPQDLSPSAVVH